MTFHAWLSFHPQYFMLFRPKAALFCAHWEIQNLVFMFFPGCVPVFPLALFLDMKRSFDIHGEQHVTLSKQFVNFYGQNFELVLLEPTLCCQLECVFFWRFSEAFIGVHTWHHSNLILRGNWSKKDFIWPTSLWKAFRFFKISQYYPVGTTSFNRVSLINLNFNKAYVR